MNETSIIEALSSFKEKYNLPDITAVDADVDNSTIHVHTANAKIWVDLPEFHEGYYVKMNVHRRNRK